MKFGIIIGSIVLVVIVGILLFAPSKSATKTDQSITFATVSKDMAAGAQLIDVRTAEEYIAGHIKGATNLSLQDIQTGSLPSVSKDTTIYVYCHSGNRSSQATTILKKSGFTNVIDLGAITHVQTIGGQLTQG